MDFLFGFFRPAIWVYFVYAAILMQISIAATTLYLHRDQTHRGVDLHPIVRHFFRFWLWLTTAIVTKQWVAVHRKHHAHCETAGDPHSPKIEGISKILLEGAELYQREALKTETQEKYGRGTPDDWLERNLYTRHNNAGIFLMLAINLLLFGAVGLTIWAFQMLTMPVLSGGIINGIGHFAGYRNYECENEARNIIPWALFCGGEELHNNHHAFPSSAKFSTRKWELDVGWLYIRALRKIGFAKVRRVPPTPIIEPKKDRIDLDTVQAVFINRMHVIRDYTRRVTLPVLRQETAAIEPNQPEVSLWRKAKRALIRHPKVLNAKHRQRLQAALEHNSALRTVHDYRDQLMELWSGAAISNEQLVARVREWCAEAEASGIQALEEFSRRLRGYRMPQANTI